MLNRVAFLAVVISCCLCTSIFAAPGTIEQIKLVDNNHVPSRVVVIHSYSTGQFVKDLFRIIKLINEKENLSEADRIKLHIVPSSGNPISALGISSEDAAKYVEVNDRFSSSDIWAQDCMEICSARYAGQTDFVPAVFDSRRGRGLGPLPKTLSEMWNLAYVANPSSAQSHGDYGGNLEVVPNDGIMVAGNTITASCKALFEKMGYAGRLFLPNTRWLSVGHIDEYLMFIPTAHAPGGYSIVRADPLYALELIEGAQDADFTHLSSSSDASFMKKVRAVLQAQRHNPQAGKGTAEGDFIELNRAISDIIEENVGKLKQLIRETSGDATRDFEEVAWPSLFTGRGGSNPSGCHAYLPGVVNMLVLRNHLVVPACHFPPFDRVIEARFRSQGNEVHFVDDEPYHNSMGEIHCGTNVLRKLDKVVFTAEHIDRIQRLKKAFRNIHDRSR
jgi:hypothetical protein